MFDRKTRNWSAPVLVVTSEAAVRGFIDAIRRPQMDNDLCNHPEDFTLYEVGTFNSSNGVITTYEEPQIIYEGFNAVPQPALTMNS